MPRFVLLCLLIGALPGCDVLSGGDIVLEPVDLPLEAGEPQGPDSPDVDGVSVTLLEPGAEPRRALRYRYELGTLERVRLTESNSGKLKDYEGAHSQSEEVLEVDVAIIPRLKKGRHLIQYDAALSNVSLRVVRGTAEDRAEAEVTQSALEGGVAQGVFSDRGLAARISPRLARIPNRSAAYAVKGLWEDVGGLPVPLPLEEVGVGARWTVVDGTEDAGVRTERTATYTLTSLDGDLGVVEITSRSLAENQAFKVARVPKGSTLVMVLYESKSTLTQRFDLSRFTPLESREKGTSTAEALATVPGYGERTLRGSDISESRVDAQEISGN